MGESSAVVKCRSELRTGLFSFLLCVCYWLTRPALIGTFTGEAELTVENG